MKRIFLGAVACVTVIVAEATTSVTIGNARFMLLTDRMVRCEWSVDGRFEDRPSLVFVNRDMPEVKYTLERRGEGAVIGTERMRLEWTGGAFTESNLVVSVANVEMLPTANANVANEGDKPNWKLGIGTGNIGNNGNIKNDMTSVAVLSEDKGNLLGTMRTIDGRSSIKDLLPRMEQGLLSRRGVTVVDDTATPLFVPGGDYWKTWVTERPLGGPRHDMRTTVGRGVLDPPMRRDGVIAPYRDITIFAYGHDYKGCLGDYVRVAGRIPLPPRWAFGYWWSRFWPDTDADYREVVRTMDSLNIPMDVCVIEMYWHETWNIGDRPDLRDESGQRVGWGGYTWNRRYFPDPKATFRFLHDNGLKAPLNVHPACGIPPMEECFDRFARDYGWKGSNTIPFRAEEERWAEVFFKDVIEPLEADGADFFWLDWQQRLMSKNIPTLSNTFWLNHLFFEHSGGPRSVAANGRAACPQAAAMGTKPVPTVSRPIIYHRWGGLGSHRYQIGFSGDGKVSWGMLEAIPWFTSSASNVGYGYWGHDLGGHMKPEGDDGANGELYTRWMQTGVFTPIFRTHTTKDRRLERRIWKFADHFLTLREAFRLRYRLGPYIYTAAREAYDTGVSICRPMYYDWPETDAAYAVTNAYMFGNDILTATVSKPVDEITQEAEIDVWFPEGTWYDVSKGELIEAGEGGRTMRRGYMVDEPPWFIKGGAVIPMYPDSVNRLGNPGTDDLVLFCAPGGLGTEVILPRPAGTPSILEGELQGTSPGTGEVARSAGGVRPIETSIYEDNGDNADYATNFRRTTIRREGNRVVIGLRKGAYTLKFPLAAPPAAAKVNGEECVWEYNAEDMAVVVRTPPQDGTSETVVELVYGRADCPQAAALSGLKGEYTRVAALTEEFRKALAGYGPGSKRSGARPEYVANLPDSWQVVWKTRDAIAANPADAERLLAERDAALRKFKADFPRLEKALDERFCRRMRTWLKR